MAQNERSLWLAYQSTYPPGKERVVLRYFLSQISTSHQVASACLFAYDYFLTVDDEARFVWDASWSAGKILFLLTRYPTFVDVAVAVYRNTRRSLSVSACEMLYETSGWLAIFGITIAEIIMMTRVWAVWGRARSIGVTLLVAAMACLAGTAVTFALFTQKNHFTREDIPGCYSSPENGSRSKVVVIAYLLSTVFEILMITLILVKGFQNLNRRSSSYLYNIYHDGVVYYGVLSSISILNVVFLLGAQPEFANLLILLQRVLHSMLSARLLLRLREDSFKRHNIFTVTQAPSESLFDFSDTTTVAPPDRWFGDSFSTVDGRVTSSQPWA